MTTFMLSCGTEPETHLPGLLTKSFKASKQVPIT